jgi:hypothetical protein
MLGLGVDESVEWSEMGVDCLISHSSPFIPNSQAVSLCIIEMADASVSHVSGSLANSPTPQVPNSPARQLVSRRH